MTYLIYKINNSQFNDDLDKMFKTSQQMAEVSIEMDQEGPDSPFQGKEAYLDGLYSHCI